MVAWPENLPPPLRDNLSTTQGDNAVRRSTQSGRVEVRKFGSGAPDEITCTFRLFGAAEVETFEYFFSHEANLGVNWFSASWLTLLGYAGHAARIVGYPRRTGHGTIYSDYAVTLHVKPSASVRADTEWPVEGPGSWGGTVPQWGAPLGQMVGFWRADEAPASITDTTLWRATNDPDRTICGVQSNSSSWPEGYPTADPPYVSGSAGKRSSGGYAISLKGDQGFAPQSFGMHARIRKGDTGSGWPFTETRLRMWRTWAGADAMALASVGNDLLIYYNRGVSGAGSEVLVATINVLTVPGQYGDWLTVSYLYHHVTGLTTVWLAGQEIYRAAHPILRGSDMFFGCKANNSSPLSVGTSYVFHISGLIIETEYNEDSVAAARAELESI